MISVLVTGANGLLGSTLVPALRRNGIQITTCSRSNADISADLADAGQAATALRAASPEVIVNLAAATNVDECERAPQTAYLKNVRIVENLVGFIATESPGVHLVQISSDQVYDGAGPHAEGEITLTNMYGFSKYSGELAAARVPNTTLRINFVGRSECPRRTTLSDWLVEQLSGGKVVTVFDDVRFSPLRLTTLAGFIEMAVRQRQIGTFNVGSHGSMSKAEFAFALAAELGLPTSLMRRGRSTESEASARRPSDMSMDSRRFEAAFGVTLPAIKDEIRLLRMEYLDET